MVLAPDYSALYCLLCSYYIPGNTVRKGTPHTGARVLSKRGVYHLKVYSTSTTNNTLIWLLKVRGTPCKDDNFSHREKCPIIYSIHITGLL